MKNLGSLALAASILLLFSGCQWFGDCGCGCGKKGGSRACTCGQTSCLCGQKDKCSCDKNSCTCPNKGPGDKKCECKCESCGAKESVAGGADAESITTNEQFKTAVLESKKPVVVKFSTEWCGACKSMKPAFEAVAKELADKYSFVEIDAEKAHDVSKQYGIRGVPAFLFFKDGQKIGEKIGAMTEDVFKEIIESNFSK